MIQKSPKEEVDPNVLRIKDICAVEDLEVPMHPGTLVELEAPNGDGKSTVLNVVDSIVNKRSGGFTSRDGTVGGEASYALMTLKIGRNGANRRLGDCMVVGIEDRLNIADFVTPLVKGEAAADTKRIRALVQLTHTSPKIDDYYALVGGKEYFESVVKDVAFDESDPVGTADKIKRGFEAAARLAQTCAENQHSTAVAKLKENEGIDLEAPHDEAVLQAALEQTIQAESRLRQQQRAAMDAVAGRQLADEELAGQRERFVRSGLSVEACEQNLSAVSAIADEAASRLYAARAEMRAAELASEEAIRNRRSAEERLQAAQEQELTLRRCEEAVRQSVAVDCPTDDQVAEAITAVRLAREAMSNGVRVRDARRRDAEAKVAEAKAAEHRRMKEFLSDAAQGTMDVLSSLVKTLSPQITIDREGRLIATGHARGAVYYGELSAGERWSLALDLAIEAFRRIGVPGVIAIPQEAWEGLDADNREIIKAKVAETDLVVITAQASRDPGATGFKVTVYGRDVAA